MEEIAPKKSQSHISKLLGLPTTSIQSMNISIGNKTEKFWNKVFSDFSDCNPFDQDDRITVDGKEMQVDLCYADGGTLYYLEMKCNLNLDSEKKKASAKKIAAVKDYLEDALGDSLNIVHGYFNPVLESEFDLVSGEKANLSSEGVRLFLVKDVMGLFSKELPFTVEEYFTFMREVVGPVLVSKL